MAERLILVQGYQGNGNVLKGHPFNQVVHLGSVISCKSISTFTFGVVYQLDCLFVLPVSDKDLNNGQQFLQELVGRFKQCQSSKPRFHFKFAEDFSFG